MVLMMQNTIQLMMLEVLIATPDAFNSLLLALEPNSLCVKDRRSLLSVPKSHLLVPPGYYPLVVVNTYNT